MSGDLSFDVGDQYRQFGPPRRLGLTLQFGNLLLQLLRACFSAKAFSCVKSIYPRRVHIAGEILLLVAPLS